MVGVDGSAASDAAARWAARDAVMRAAPLTLVHVVMPTPLDSTTGPAAGASQCQQDRARQIIDQAGEVVDEAVGHAVPDVHTEVRYARVIPTLLEASRAARMVVVGRRGPGSSPPDGLGSVATGMLHHAPCPVVVVPDAGAGGDRAPVLLGIDGSPASAAATAVAFDEASRRGVSLTALHAWSDVGVFPVLGMDTSDRRDGGREVLARQLAGWQGKFPDVPVHERLVCDVPAHWLVDESRNAQLVVVGRHGRGWRGDLHLGSVTSAVARTARAPVMVVPATTVLVAPRQTAGQRGADAHRRRP